MKNDFYVLDDYAVIKISSPTYGELETKISKYDLSRAKRLTGTWQVSNLNGFLYVTGSVRNNGKLTTHLLHRYILDVTDRSIHIDHFNHDTLDNRRTNLRRSTVSQNGQNRSGVTSRNTSGVLGVSFIAKANKYQATLCIRNKQYYVGKFEHLSDAENVMKLARKYLMEFSQESNRSKIKQEISFDFLRAELNEIQHEVEVNRALNKIVKIQKECCL